MPILQTLWNTFIDRAPPPGAGTTLGHRIIDGYTSKLSVVLSETRRTEHITVLGKTGTGKTSLMKSLLAQDIRADRGLLCIDLHGDLSPFILGRIREREHRTGEDLSRRVVIIDPADPNQSVGINILRPRGALAPLVSELVSVFRRRWQLDKFGARTEELLRNSLWALAEDGWSLLELTPFLTELAFRAPVIERCTNADVKAYFRGRYEHLSEAMQAVMREPILNKASAFSLDPAIRHLVGHSAPFDLRDALDAASWIILRVDKARLGEDAELLASLVLALFKDAIFSRRSRNLFTLYADEVQNLVSSADTFSSLLAEARKFGVGVVTATQHLGQYPPSMRATLLSAGTAIFFRMSSEDAPLAARALDGGLTLERTLKELPNRHFLIRSGSTRHQEVRAADIAHNTTSVADLIARSNAHYATSHQKIENDIAARRRAYEVEALDDWR